MSPKVMLIWVITLIVILMTKWNPLYHLKNIKKVNKLQLIYDMFWL